MLAKFAKKYMIMTVFAALLPLCLGCESSAPEPSGPFADLDEISGLWVVDCAETEKLRANELGRPLNAEEAKRLERHASLFLLDMDYADNTMRGNFFEMKDDERKPFMLSLEDGVLKIFTSVPGANSEAAFTLGDYGSRRLVFSMPFQDDLVLVRQDEEPCRVAMREQYGKYSGLWKMDLESVMEREKSRGRELGAEDMADISGLRLRLDFTKGELDMCWAWDSEDGPVCNSYPNIFAIGMDGGFMLQLYDKDGDPAGSRFEWTIIDDDTAGFMYEGEPESAQVIVRVK